MQGQYSIPEQNAPVADDDLPSEFVFCSDNHSQLSLETIDHYLNNLEFYYNNQPSGKKDQASSVNGLASSCIYEVQSQQETVQEGSVNQSNNLSTTVDSQPDLLSTLENETPTHDSSLIVLQDKYQQVIRENEFLTQELIKKNQIIAKQQSELKELTSLRAEVSWLRKYAQEQGSYTQHYSQQISCLKEEMKALKRKAEQLSTYGSQMGFIPGQSPSNQNSVQQRKRKAVEKEQRIPEARKVARKSSEGSGSSDQQAWPAKWFRPEDLTACSAQAPCLPSKVEIDLTEEDSKKTGPSFGN